MKLDFHFAVICLMAFITLGKYSLEEMHPAHAELKPLPPIHQFTKHEAARAVLYAFNVGGAR